MTVGEIILLSGLLLFIFLSVYLLCKLIKKIDEVHKIQAKLRTEENKKFSYMHRYAEEAAVHKALRKALKELTKEEQ